MTTSTHHTYEVALSFAGENRPYVARVAQALTNAGVRVFYDEYEAATLWGKDLYTHLRDVYQHQARYTIIFASRHYASKVWTGHERQSAQARAMNERSEYILPARFDDTDIPGLLHTIGYIDLRRTSPEQLASLVLAKLGRRSGSWEVETPTILPGEAHAREESLRERAARLAGQYRTQQSREQLLASERGVQVAGQEAKKLFDYIRTEVTALREQDPELEISAAVGNDGVLLVRSRRASFTMYWRLQYGNTLKGASLFTREFNGPHSLGLVKARARAAHETHVKFDVDESLNSRWRDDEASSIALSTSQLGDKYLSRVIERSYGPIDESESWERDDLRDEWA